tara:strand:+ start:549 stop:1031 length:483 start_codon:yes stop_codon:yes gene_type:complete
MELSKSLLSISLTILLIAACSSVQVTEESVTESSIATVEVTSPETYQTKTAAISTSATIYFDFDKSNLTSRSIQTLRGVISSMKDNSSLTLVLEGHADERGTREYNLALGQRRAESVADYLESRGIKRSRLVVKSYGEERPAVDSSNERAWARNRRVEIK